MTIKVFTAFSGYDSQCLALDRLVQENNDFSYELVGWSEIDKYAIQAHNAIFPGWWDRNYGDITQINWDNVPDFDLFTYSSPCQDFSNAGKQAGGQRGSGTRSSLLWECERAIRAKRPRYLLFENVAALVSSKFINTFHGWLNTLHEIGYTNFPCIMNAKDYGVPQNRKRIFVVSILDTDATYTFPQKMKLTRRLKDVLEDSVDEKYYLTDERLYGIMESTQKQKDKGNGFKFAPTDVDCVAHSVTIKNGSRKTDNFVQQVGMLEGEQWKGLYESARRVYGTDGVSPALNTFAGGGLEHKIVLGWTRDHSGNVTKRPVVSVANCVTSGKRDNTQNYVVENEYEIKADD